MLSYESVSPSRVHFSKPFKQDRAYRLAIYPKFLVKTPEFTCLTDFMVDGETSAKAAFKVPDAFQQWFKSIEKRVVSHVKRDKEAIFKDNTITDDFIEANFVSNFTKNGLEFRISRDAIVYDEATRQPVSPSNVKAGSRVSLVVSPTFVDFGKKNFTCKWSIVTARLVGKGACKIVDEPDEN
jgi:hypothetical protein